MGFRLTTHVLDILRGTGAAGMKVSLRRVAPDPAELGEIVLDAGGRGTLLEMPAGTGIFELTFFAGAYQGSGENAFLGEIPVRFGIDQLARHYHVPLVLSAYGYSVYRGG